MDMAQARARLRSLIGQRVRHGALPCRVIDVLDREQVLVLEVQDGQAEIQPSQYGDAYRRVPRTITLPIFNEQGTDYHEDFLSLTLTEPADQ